MYVFGSIGGCAGHKHKVKEYRLEPFYGSGGISRLGIGASGRQETAPPSVRECMSYLLREPDAGKPPVRFDEREVETE